MSRKKLSTMTTLAMEKIVHDFIDEHFNQQEVLRLMQPVESDKMPYHSAAEMVYRSIEQSRPDIIDQLDRFTPHPSCRFSLIRDVLHLRSDKTNEVFSHVGNPVITQKVNTSAAAVFSGA